MPKRSRMKFICPEVIQTSAMDCGPAAIYAVLQGFGLEANWDELRDACNTGVDGTSIDQLENVCLQNGLKAEQIMLPTENIFQKESSALPAIVITETASGDLHFVVVWRKVGSKVLIMNPAVGRRWVSTSQLKTEIYQHTMVLPAEAWRSWSQSEEAIRSWQSRLNQCGIRDSVIQTQINKARADKTIETFACLDAAIKTLEQCQQLGGLRPGSEAEALFESLMDSSLSESESLKFIPEPERTAQIYETEQEGNPLAKIRGAVLIRIEGVKQQALQSSKSTAPQHEETTPKPKFTKAKGLIRSRLEVLDRWALLEMVGWTCASTFVVWFQALIFQALIGSGDLATRGTGWILALLGFMAFLSIGVGFEYFGFKSRFALGRAVEGTEKLSIATSLSRLEDKYFRTRLLSDMVERVHAIRAVRGLPTAVSQMIRSASILLATALGIYWIDPTLLLPTIIAIVSAAAVPLFFLRRYEELDLRCRSFNAALGRHYLDALRGVWALRAHRAGQALYREQQQSLVLWSDAILTRSRYELLIDGALSAVGFGTAFWILGTHFKGAGIQGGSLLVIYWALRLPEYASQFSSTLQQLPKLRNVLKRSEEMLASRRASSPNPGQQRKKGVEIELKNVSVVVEGVSILNSATFKIHSGEHIAVIGNSGAGKSSLVGLLLGWNEPSIGEIEIDGQPLTYDSLVELRRRTIWISPEVHLWNRSLEHNLEFGNESLTLEALEAALEKADLWPLVSNLAEGTRSLLGEGGANISGGEGQRVRIGRALSRRNVELVIMDEPFRGLERSKRGRLLDNVRTQWPHATVLYVTHDVEHARVFDRVLVLKDGSVQEFGTPDQLLHKPNSTFSMMLKREADWLNVLRKDPQWERKILKNGRLQSLQNQKQSQAIPTTPQVKVS